MKIAIMQPYFFPYIGYFSLIKNTDHFIFFDTPQYIRKGWINRNRIIGANGDATFFSVPVQKMPRETAINKMLISQNEDWKQKILGQLNIYKRAPHYLEVLELVQSTLNIQTLSISELAIKSIINTCEYLGIKVESDIFSRMNISLPQINGPDEWALYITKQLGYDTYVNPPGGKSFFSREKYINENIELQFLSTEIVPYRQKGTEFIPALSIIDVMMFCDVQTIHKMLDNYKLEE